MSARFGIIAEDQSDVDTLRAIFKLYGLKGFSVDKFVGKGCGKIKGKCLAWAKNLKIRGCNRLILLHDSDDNAPAALEAEINAALGVSPIERYVVVIAVRELEAWLLADHKGIKTSMNLKAVKRIANPEAIRRPKEHLRDVIYRESGKKISYNNTVHNREIASACSLEAFRRCASFAKFDSFIHNNVL
jgi:hypothetical protein